MKAKINLKNIKGFLQAHYRQVLDDFDYLEPHIKEQAKFRLWRVKEKSPECYENNICTHCGCEVSSKVFEDRPCSANFCYPELLSKEKWEEFKSIHPTYKKFLMGEGSLTESACIIIRDLSKEETLADLMENNPSLDTEELLYWCPEFKDDHPHLTNNELSELNSTYTIGVDDAPGIKGTKFKIKLSKDQFSGVMTPEQIQEIADEYKDYL